MNSPNITVIVPVRNGEKYLRHALESVKDQLIAGDKIILQDGNSTDNTVGVARETISDPSVLTVVTEQDTGQADAFNKALQRVTTNCVLWLNADDEVASGCLDALRKAATDGRTAVHGGHRIVDGNGEVLRSFPAQEWNYHRFLSKGCYVFSGSVLWPTGVLKQLQGLDSSRHFSMDLDLALRASRQGVRFTAIPETVGVFRWHADSKSGSDGWKFSRDSAVVRWRNSTKPKDYALTAVGMAMHVASSATIYLRFNSNYQELRERAVRLSRRRRR